MERWPNDPFQTTIPYEPRLNSFPNISSLVNMAWKTDFVKLGRLSSSILRIESQSSRWALLTSSNRIFSYDEGKRKGL